MNSSNFRDITDELLSAYLDDQVTPQERTQIEAAIAADSVIAWRLDSLRQTVVLLRALPEIPLPRAFVIQPQQVRDVVTARQTAAVDAPSLWAPWRDGWRNFWQAGNPLLRNAAAVSFAVMLALLSSNRLLTVSRSPVAPNPSMAAAPAAESVALAPPTAKIAGPQTQAGAAPATDAETASDAAAGAEPAADTTATTDAPAATEDAPMSASAVAPAAEAAPIEEPAPVEESAAEAEAPAEIVPEAAIAAAPMPMPGAPDLFMPPGAGMGGGDGIGIGAGGGGGDAMMGGGPGAPIGGGGGEGGLLPPDARALDPARLMETPTANVVPEAAAAAAAPAADVAAAEAVTETADQAADQNATAAPTETPAAVALAAPTSQPAAEPTAEGPAATPAEPAVGTSAEIDGEPTAAGLPVIPIAQGVSVLLTVMLGSLWWHSRRG